MQGKKVSGGLLEMALGLATGAMAVVGKAFGAPTGHTVDGLKIARDTIKDGIKDVRKGWK